MKKDEEKEKRTDTQKKQAKHIRHTVTHAHVHTREHARHN